jgi:hypothetical protein
VAVILKRLATDFFVFIPFGRRIQIPVKMSAKYRRGDTLAQVESRSFFGRADRRTAVTLAEKVGTAPQPDESLLDAQH